MSAPQDQSEQDSAYDLSRFGVEYSEVVIGAFRDTLKDVWSSVINSQNEHFDQIAKAAGVEGDGEAKNAIAHAAASAYFEVVASQAFGETVGDLIATGLGHAKEMTSDPSEHLDSLKDELNNQVGREIGAKIIANGGDTSDIKVAVEEAFERGDLWVSDGKSIKPSGEFIGDRFDPEGQDSESGAHDDPHEGNSGGAEFDSSDFVDWLLGTELWGLDVSNGSFPVGDGWSDSGWSGQTDGQTSFDSSSWSSSTSDSGFGDHGFDGGFGTDSHSLSDFASGSSMSGQWQSDHHNHSSSNGPQSDFRPTDSNNSSNGRWD